VINQAGTERQSARMSKITIYL